MSERADAAAIRYANARPGSILLGAEEVALPVSWLTLDLLAQEMTRVSLIEEFVLRAAHQGVVRVDEVAGLLGLTPSDLQPAVAAQLAADTIDYQVATASGIREIRLTPLGVAALDQFETSRPKRLSDRWAFDRLVWQPASWTRAELIDDKQATSDGLRKLRPVRTTAVRTDDVTASALNEVLGEGRGNARVNVLAVEAVVNEKRLFVRAVLLIYRTIDTGEIDLGLVVDGAHSPRHDEALERLGGATALGISVEDEDTPIPADDVIPSDVLAQRATRDAVVALQQEIEATALALTQTTAAAVPAVDEAQVEELQAESERARRELDELDIRWIGVYEHREVLREALEKARRRLLIISPWIRGAVVDNTFVSRLERLLRRDNFVAYIAYGIGDSDDGTDRSAVQRLRQAADRHKNLQLLRLRNTHTKILIYDDVCVTTSFNWLSFRGDPNRTYRMEEGTLIRRPELVDHAWDRYVELIGREATSPPRKSH